MIKIEVCPGNLTPGFDRYSPACLRRLFDGKKVCPVLDFSYDADKENFSAVINQISVSGVQEKLSAIVDKVRIVLTPEGEQGSNRIGVQPKKLATQIELFSQEHSLINELKCVRRFKFCVGLSIQKS